MSRALLISMAWVTLPLVMATAQAPIPDAERFMRQAEAAAEDRSPEAQRAAAALFERAAAEWRATPGPEANRGEARAWYRAGECHTRGGDLQAAVEALERALPLALDGADEGSELPIEILDALSYAHYRSGDRDAALETLRRALRIARDTGNHRAEAGMLNNIASVYTSWGEDQLALEHYRQAVDVKREHGITEGLGANLGNLAIVYVGLGEPEHGIRLLEEALVLSRRLDEHTLEARTLLNLGKAHSELGDAGRAEAYYEKSLALHRTLPDGTPFSALISVASKRLERGDVEAARPLIEEAGALARESGYWGYRVHALNLRGRLEAAAGRPDAALELFERSREVAAEADQLQAVADAEHHAATVLRDVGRLAEARRLVEAAIATREQMAAELLNARLRSSARSFHRDHYDLWLDVLARQHERNPAGGHDAEAFAASERARARSILETFSHTPPVDADAAPERLLEERRKLDAEIAEVQRRLRRHGASDDTADRTAELETRLEALVPQRERLDEALQQAAHDTAALLRLEPLALASIQAALPREAALIEYFIGNDSALVFVVTHQKLRLRRLDTDASELDALVGRMRRGLERPSGRALDAYLRAGRRLYELLLAPLEPDLADHELLLIAPDGPLHYVPFEALPTGRSGAAGIADLPYLLRRHAVAYVPSGSTLALLAQRGQPRDPSDRLFVVADPEYGAAASEEAGEERGLALRSVFGPDRSWSPRPLPFARREAEGLVELAGAERVTVLAGADATEERFKADPTLRRAGAVHFATHALVSEREPTYSGLVLAMEERGAEDGLLQVYEIAELDLAADLAVLSACETGLGRAVRGEGLVGLTQAFLAAGANSLVVSLWPVADASTAELMLAFYESLEEPAEKAAALRRAKLRLLASERFAHPYYWAPFILQGTPQ